jgi:hypothetical protein
MFIGRVRRKGMHWEGSYVFGTAGAAFRGQASDNSHHSHATLQIVGSAEEPAVLERPSLPSVIGPYLLIRPGIEHALQPIKGVTLVFLEPQTAAARRVLDLAPPGDIIELPDEFSASARALRSAR